MDRLTPTARELADAAASGPSLADLPLDAAREAIRQMAPRFGAGDAVAAVEDLEVPTDHGSVACRAYRPEVITGLPPLLWLHAGGWCTGDLDTCDALCRRLAARLGCDVVSVDYRLAPEAPHPAALDDIDVAVRWLADRDRRPVADRAGICIGGDSAGGNLAAAYSVRVADDPSIAIAGQLLLFAPLDLRGGYASETTFGEGFFATMEEFTRWVDLYLAGRDPGDPLASPLLGVGDRLPPTMVVTAECDPLRDSGEAFAAALRSAGVRTDHHRFDGQIHDFVLLGDLVAEADLATDLIARRFTDLLRG